MDEEIKKILEENLKLTQEIYEMTKKIKSFITFQKVMSFVYFFLIVGPLVLGIIFLPPLLKNVFSQYSELLGGEGGFNIESLLKGGQAPAGLNLNNLDLKNLNTSSLSPAAQKELQKIINDNPNLKNIDVNKLSPELQKEALKYIKK